MMRPATAEECPGRMFLIVTRVRQVLQPSRPTVPGDMSMKGA